MHDAEDHIHTNGSANGHAPSDELTERTEDLLRRAGELRRRCEELGERLDSLTGAANGFALPAEPAEGIRIVATNLVLNGADRREVDTRLRDEFGRVDNDALLDDVFAAAARGSDGSRRRRFARRG